MKKNIGTKDRILRLLLSASLMLLALYDESIIVGLVALFVLYEAVAGWCVVYQLLGKSSCKK